MKVKPRARFKGEARRQRKTLTLRVPDDATEDGAGLWDDLIERVREKLGQELETSGPDSRPIYYVISDALNDWLTS